MLDQWQIDIINSKIREPVFSIEWLTPDEKVIDEAILDVVSGSLNFDATNTNRRSGTLTFKNLDGQYIPSPNSKLWINHKVKIKAGYKYNNGNDYLWFNQGTYVLGNPSILSSSTQKEVTIQLNDKWLLLNGEISGKLKNKTVIPVDTRIDKVVKDLVVLAGETKYIIDPCDYTTPYTIEKEPGNSIGDILLELADMYSYEIFYDNNGYLRFRKAIQPEDIEQTAPSWTYNQSGLYLQSNRELQWDEVRNYIIVYGAYDEDTGIQYKGEAKDETGSPYSIDQIGERVEILELDELYDNSLCIQRSRKELFDRIKVQEKVTETLIPNYSHSLEDVITLNDESNGCSGNYLIQQITYSISHNSTMTLGLWKSRKWS